jgi:hypothetical protein
MSRRKPLRRMSSACGMSSAGCSARRECPGCSGRARGSECRRRPAPCREGLLAVGAGEGDVAAGVPVLGEDDVVELRGEGVDAGEDGVAVSDRERAAGEEVELHVDDEQGIGCAQGDAHGSDCTSAAVAAGETASRYAERVTPQQIQARGERILGRQLGRAMLMMTVLLCAAMARAAERGGPAATGVLDGVVNDVGGTPVAGRRWC